MTRIPQIFSSKTLGGLATWRSILILSLLLLLTACQREEQTLRLATTTSTYDSGLLDAILPTFEKEFNAKIDVVSVGTGQALAMGAAGDVDVLLVHARSREDQFVAAGDGSERRDVMCNDFVIVGSAENPAQLTDPSNATTSLTQIAKSQSTFISRGDDSGTHIREQALWEAAAISPAGDWYQSVGQGMGATLTLADEQKAYTLTDRATFIKRKAAGLGLDIAVEGDPMLLNPYGVIRINPDKFDGINEKLAKSFVEWLTSAETLNAIAAYQINGQQLFFTNPTDPPNCMGGNNSSAAPFSANPFISAFRLMASGNNDLWRIVTLSLFVSGVSIIVAAILGVPLGAWLGLRQPRGERWLTAFIYTGMGFPPVVIGLFVYLLLSRSGPLGSLNWLLTARAMIMAQIILALPLVIGVTMSAVRAIDPALKPQLRALGATPAQIVQTILREARQGVIVGLVAGFGAAISEVGAVMLVGGNIAGRTRVLTTAIVLETRQGNFDLALALGIILLLLAFIINSLVLTLRA